MPLAKAFVALRAFGDLLTTGAVLEVVQSLPADTKMLLVQPDAARGGFWLVLESAEFAEVAPGALLPDVTLRVSRITYLQDLSKPLPSREERLDVVPVSVFGSEDPL